MASRGLPDSLDEFKQLAITTTCESCGQVRRRRWIEGGECLGCRYGGETA